MKNEIVISVETTAASTTTTASTPDLIEELKRLPNNIGPRELSSMGKMIADAIVNTVPNGLSLKDWVTINLSKIDEIIFDNFDYTSLVHALGFAKLELRKYN